MTPDTTTTHPADGTLDTRDGRHVLRYERRLSHPIDRVWAALTEPRELRGWLADADIELVRGGRVQLRWLNSDDEGNSAVADGTVTALDPPRLLELDTDPHGILRWELREAGGGTDLTFTASVPAPNEAVRLARAGWHIHLEHLADALDGRSVDWPAWSTEHRPRWDQIHDAYAASGT
ncbi:MAG: hypothetical protein QOH72_3477 [Solirubrobacteraceae bacterium]|jgi:uncharacterized protein YndB with AHSA1/START domain|nr:hypothetical protein [Solirubrobacteraceae bacterium]